MKIIQDMLNDKSTGVWTIRQEESVFEAVTIMDEKGISALPVVDGGTLVGIISDRDCTRRVLHRRLNPDTTRIKEIMTKEVITVDPEHSLDYCMQLIHTKKLRHLPVLENNTVVGMISIGDILKEMIAEHEQTIRHLENYITAG